MGNKHTTHVDPICLIDTLMTQPSDTVFHGLHITYPDVTHNTTHLKHHLNQLQHSHEKQQFLNTRVVSCNYSSKQICCVNVVRDVFLIHVSSELTIGEHLRMFGLESDCEIGINQSDQVRLMELH